MSATAVRSAQIKDGGVARADLNVSTTGEAVVRKIVAGTGVSIGYDGADSGTGDVTVNSSAASDPPFATLAPTGSVTIAAGTGVVVPDHYTIANGQTLTIANGAYLMIL